MPTNKNVKEGTRYKFLPVKREIYKFIIINEWLIKHQILYLAAVLYTHKFIPLILS